MGNPCFRAALPAPQFPQPEWWPLMRHLLPALALTLAGVCIPVSPDFAAPAAELKTTEQGPADRAVDSPPNSDRDQTALADIGAADSAAAAASGPSRSSDNASGRP